jgi:hypothetical protein
VGEIEQFATKLRENWRGVWQAYRWLVTTFVIAVFCDAVSTMYFMTHRPQVEEANPGVRWVSQWLGPLLGPLLAALGKIIAGLFVATTCRRIALYVLVAATLISFWAAWYNLWGIDLYTPRFAKWLNW